MSFTHPWMGVLEKRKSPLQGAFSHIKTTKLNVKSKQCLNFNTCRLVAQRFVAIPAHLFSPKKSRPQGLTCPFFQRSNSCGREHGLSFQEAIKAFTINSRLPLHRRESGNFFAFHCIFHILCEDLESVDITGGFRLQGPIRPRGGICDVFSWLSNSEAGLRVHAFSLVTLSIDWLGMGEITPILSGIKNPKYGIINPCSLLLPPSGVAS